MVFENLEEIAPLLVGGGCQPSVVEELIGLMADAKVTASLPAALTTLGLESSSFEVMIPDDGDVSVAFEARVKEHWKIVDGMIEMESAHLQVHVDGGDASGFFAGTLRFGERGEVEVPIAIERSAESATWRLRLACSGRELAGPSALTAIPRGVPIPADLPALELSEFTVVFGEAPGTRKTEARSIALKAALKDRWPRGLTEFDLRDVTLDVKIEQPAAPHPEVDAALQATVDIAGVAVPIAATWQTH